MHLRSVAPSAQHSEVSYDTREFEVPAELDDVGRLTDRCASQAAKALDEHGFVVMTQLLSDAESAAGLQLVRDAIANPNRERGTFASQTDIRYVRRDFCPLPSVAPVLSYSAKLCQRLEKVLVEFCGRRRPVLEISTLTSYFGSSHQYIHRDPDGVLCLFVAVDDVSAEQGGTLFVPGTHRFSGSDMRHGGRSDKLMHLFQVMCNIRILRYNLANLRRMRKEGDQVITQREFLDRTFSRRRDNHQPNMLRFLLGKSGVFKITMLGPLTLLKLWRERKVLQDTFRLVQAAPKRGTVILYRSDMLHAGPNNRTAKPRCFFSLSIARDAIHPELQSEGYSPHSTLLTEPKTLGDLLDRYPLDPT